MKFFQKYLKIHPIIFKRVFSKLTADSKKDLLTTILFVLVIAISSALIFRSSFEIINSRIGIKKFIDNDWNKIFYLYLLNTVDLDSDLDIQDIKKEEVPRNVVSFLDSLDSSKDCSIKKGYLVFPEIISIKSQNKIIPKIQCFLFGKENREILEKIEQQFPGENIYSQPTIFLQRKIAEQLNLRENDLVMVKITGMGSLYTMPLYAKIINEETKFKCFMLQNYLQDNYNDQKLIRFYFNDIDEAFHFLVKEAALNWKLDYPLYFGIGDQVFGAFKANNDKVKDLILRTGYIEETNALKFSDKLILGCDNGENIAIYSKPISGNDWIEIDKNKLFRELREKGFSSADSINFEVDMFEKNNTSQKLFVEINFRGNFYNLNNKLNRQELLFEYGTLCDSLHIDFQPDEVRQEDAYSIMYYNNFQDNELNRKILNKFDSFNIRWDSGKWKTIVDLHESLQKGKRHLSVIIMINFFIFLFFLIVKFYLKMKLEFHTIGTIRCFGFSMKDISRNYRLGYTLLILLGFIISIPFSFILAVYSGFTTGQAWNFLSITFSNPFNYVFGYLAALIIITNLVIWYILRNLIRGEDIYELIKYEN